MGKNAPRRKTLLQDHLQGWTVKMHSLPPYLLNPTPAVAAWMSRNLKGPKGDSHLQGPFKKPNG